MALININAAAAVPNGKYPGYWVFKKIRRGLRNHASAWLARSHAAQALVPLDPALVSRVIVCRRNNRLGNTLFLVPLLRSLAQTLPRAEIDVLIGNADYACLFWGLPGIRRVWVMPRRGWTYPLQMLWLLMQLRRQGYALSIEPTLNSFSNRLLAWLCKARWRLGFHTADQWLNLTHAVMPNRTVRHEALKSLQLIRQGFAINTPSPVSPRLELTEAEQQMGKTQLRAILGTTGNGPIIGFCMQATGNKQLPQGWWMAWLEAMRQSGRQFHLLQLLPPDATPALDPDLPVMREPNYRRLVAVMRGFNVFVSCDAGPMHLAAAAGTPTIGLFHATDHHRYGPLGGNCLGLDTKAQTPEKIAQRILSQFVYPVIHTASGNTPNMRFRKYSV